MYSLKIKKKYFYWICPFRNHKLVAFPIEMRHEFNLLHVSLIACRWNVLLILTPLDVLRQCVCVHQKIGQRRRFRNFWLQVHILGGGERSDRILVNLDERRRGTNHRVFATIWILVGWRCSIGANLTKYSRTCFVQKFVWVYPRACSNASSAALFSIWELMRGRKT